MERADRALISEVLQETDRFYRLVTTLYEREGYSGKYPLTDLWGRQNMKVLLEVIDGKTDPVDKIAAIHKTYFYSVQTSDEEVKNKVIDWYLEYLAAREVRLDQFSTALQESRHANPRNAVTRHGRLLSPDFLRALILSTEIGRHCRLPGQSFNILELGAGYGALARVLKLLHPHASYVITDIPQSLYFSAAFLRLSFPGATFRYVTDPSHLDAAVGESDFVFVPTMLAKHLSANQFTLFCNTASLGEMKNEVIRYWMDFVQNRVSVQYFFGLNRFLNTIYPPEHPHHQRFRLEENCCSVSFDTRWRILRWELEPPFTRCPYLETEVSRNLEIIAERLPADSPDQDEIKRRSQGLVDAVSKQDWFVHCNADNTMKLRDNILAPDLTMSGTLFALWESIRLNPNPTNLSMMLKYLRTLTRGKPFEEMYFYQDMLNSLVGSPPPSREPLSLRRILRRLTTPGMRRLLQRIYYGTSK